MLIKKMLGKLLVILCIILTNNLYSKTLEKKSHTANHLRKDLSKKHTKSVSNKPKTMSVQSKHKDDITNKETKSIRIIKEFFSTQQILSGKFLHIVHTHEWKNDTAEAVIASMNDGKNEIKNNVQTNKKHFYQDYSGNFILDLYKPVRFKWKYIHPFIRQIVKNNKQNKQLLYKEGQSKQKSADGVVVEQVNMKKPYIIQQSLPLTFMFDVPVESWINDIIVTNVIENHNYIKITCQYKQFAQKGFLKNLKTDSIQLVFSKYPLCLIQWSFKDQKGHYNQITLFNIAFLAPNKIHDEQMFEMD